MNKEDKKYIGTEIGTLCPDFATVDIIDRITEYLSAGGLFNPEYMEHDKVRNLLIDCRDKITKLIKEKRYTGEPDNLGHRHGEDEASVAF